MKKGDKYIYFTFDTMQRQISPIEQPKLIFYDKLNILIVPSKTHTNGHTNIQKHREKQRHGSKRKEKKKKRVGN